jgi:hypothetical protein
MSRRYFNTDMRSPTDEACLHEDTYRPSTQAESDARYAAFKAGTLAPEFQRSRRGLDGAFHGRAA